MSYYQYNQSPILQPQDYYNDGIIYPTTFYGKQSPIQANNHLGYHVTQNSISMSSPISTGSTSSVSTVSSLSSRNQYFCSKGFDLDDDFEYCPEIEPVQPKEVVDYASEIAHPKFNPYKSVTFSPGTSPAKLEKRVSKKVEIVNPRK